MKAKQIKNEITWDWMQPEMAMIESEKTIEEAVVEMNRLGIHHLLVMMNKQFVGLLDARDCTSSWKKNTSVADVMRREVPVVDENTGVGEVVDLMLCHRLTALPLSRNKKICGILTETDLLRLLHSYLTPVRDISDLIQRGKDILATPILQTLMNIGRDLGI